MNADLRRFSGSVVLVTGAASGIGWATAQRFAQEGAIVWLSDLHEDALRERAALLPAARALRLDVTESCEADAAIERVLTSDGRLDVVVNCAGVAHGATVQETASHDWDRVLRVNLTGTFNVSRAALRAMSARGSGAVVNVASDAGLVGMESQAAYCAAKGGVVHFTKACALDAAPYQVRVNCVCPCFVATPLLDAWVATQPDPAKALPIVRPSSRSGASVGLKRLPRRSRSWPPTRHVSSPACRCP